MLRFLLFPALLLFVLCPKIHAQYSALKIGEQLPEIEFGNILNKPQAKIYTNELRGKLVILDFWNIHCKNCIAAMPKMDSLQQMFGEKLQIISITSNTSDQVNRLFARIKISKPNFPFIIEDSIFKLLFPHQGDPLHVWINEQGKVVAITNDYNTTTETLEQYFSGTMPMLSRRWDFGINTENPLVSEANSGLLNYALNYSVLFKSMEEFSSSNSIKESDSSIQVINGNLLQLYKIAYKNELYGFPVNLFNIPIEDRTLLLVKDKTPFLVPDSEKELSAWVLQFKYCYELKLSSLAHVCRDEIMKADLLRYFPYKVSIEKQKVRGLALIKLPVQEPASVNSVDKRKSLKIDNKPIAELITQLNSVYAWKNLAVVDESGLEGRFTFHLHPKLSDINSLNSDLKYYGLKLIHKDFDINFLVIRDK